MTSSYLDTLNLFGRRVRARRNLMGMKQGDLASAVGRTRTSLANIEAGRQNPPITLVEQIAAAFGITSAELLATEPAPNEDDRIPELTFNAVELYRRLGDRRLERSLTWRDVAQTARVSPSTLTRLGGGGMCDATGLVRLLAWLGDMDLAPYVDNLDDQPSTNDTNGAI